MSESFASKRFGKTVWLTNHAIESMAKRRVTLPEIQTLIEHGSLVEALIITPATGAPNPGEILVTY